MTQTLYQFDKLTGKFIVDPNIKKIGNLAITVYTGSVIVLKNTVYNKQTNTYTGVRNNGMDFSIKKSQILCIKKIN